MDFEEDAFIMFRPDPRLPIADVETIAARLDASGALTPGFVAPEAGLLSIHTMMYAEHVEKLPTLLLPDRNVVTRMARIAREGILGREDPPSRLALDLMAFAQAMNVAIEPGLAFHELAHRVSNEVANEELCWFRAADEGGGRRASAWIDLAVGRSDRLPPMEPKPSEQIDLDHPPHRWRCNYAVMLKAASLELDPELSPIQRLERLIRWMVDDFILAAPAAMVCMMLMAPHAPLAGLVKGLRSLDRDKALAGVKNAAWDVTYLSELVRRAAPESYEQARCIFASGDRTLADLAPLLLLDAKDRNAYREQLAMRVGPRWRKDAQRIVDILIDGIDAVQGRPPPEAPPGVEDYIGLLIEEGEAAVARPI